MDKKMIKDIEINFGKLERIIESLAVMTRNGFKELEEKLGEKMKKGFGEVNDRLDTIKKITNNHESRIDNMEDKILKVETILKI